jgi:hypothetical protein
MTKRTKTQKNKIKTEKIQHLLGDSLEVVTELVKSCRIFILQLKVTDSVQQSPPLHNHQQIN